MPQQTTGWLGTALHQHGSAITHYPDGGQGKTTGGEKQCRQCRVPRVAFVQNTARALGAAHTWGSIRVP